MRDIVGHDRQPASYLVYLYLYGQAARNKWKPVPASLRMLADATGLSKSAVQTALEKLRYRELIRTTNSDHPTAVPPVTASFRPLAKMKGPHFCGYGGRGVAIFRISAIVSNVQTIWCFLLASCPRQHH